MSGVPNAAYSGQVTGASVDISEGQKSMSGSLTPSASTPVGPYTLTVTITSQSDSSCTYQLNYTVNVQSSGGGGTNNSQCVSTNFSASVTAGQNFSGTVVVRNIGSNSWHNTAPNQYGLTSPQGSLWTTTGPFSTQWLGMPFTPVPSNTDVTFNVNATATTTPGSYSYNFQMLQNSVAWFGPICTANITVNPVANTPPTVSIQSPTATAYSNSNLPLRWTAADTGGISLCEVQLNTGNWMRYPVCNNNTTTETQLSYVHMPTILGTAATRLLALDFAENAGSTAYDRSGNGNNAALVNSPSWVAGQYGRALSFNGTSQYVNLGNSSTLRPAGAFSVAAWVNANASQVAYPQIISSGDNTGVTGWNLYIQNGSNQGAASFIIKDSGAWGTCYALGTTNLKGAGWKFVVGTFDGTNIRIYVDGVLQTSDTCSGAIQYGTSPSAEVGRKFNTAADTYFTGSIDEVALYSRVLTAAEIAAMFTNSAFNGAHTLNARVTDTSAQLSPTASVNFSINLPNQPPVSIATISTNGSTYSNSITVTQGVPVNVYLGANYSNAGVINTGSSDPDGWTHATLGMSGGTAKCDWNSDLNQGAATYE
ncbi:MAG: LamG domain-containing protein, partial [Patescibacteria group bacterium]